MPGLFAQSFLTLNLVAALIVGAAQGQLAAQEWTRFRGPNGTGQSDAATIPTAWTERDVNWKIDLPGIGHSSPVIWGDKLFVASADPASGTRMLFAIRTQDGKVLWKKEYPATIDQVHAQNSLASSTPACDADHVYFAWAMPEQYNLLAYDHEGKEVWRAGLGKFVARHGFGASPIVYEDLVIITNDQEADSFLIAVDRGTGKTRWKQPRKTLSPQSASYSTPFIFTPPGGEDELIVHSWAHGMTSHIPRTGGVNWEAQVFDPRPVSSPVLAGGLIWGSCGDGGGRNSVVAVRPGNKDGKPAEVVHRFGRSGNLPYVPTIVASGDLVFLWGDRGFVACIDAPSGKVHYQNARVGGDYFSSPILIGDRIFNVSAQGELVVLAASPQFEILARHDLGDPTSATPAVADGKLFIRTQTRLMSIGGQTESK